MLKFINGDCINVLQQLIDTGVKVDAIITDPPYGTSACKWDSVIDLKHMWYLTKNLIKDNGAIVLFGNEPFSSQLRLSNIKNYKYDWKWLKTKPSGHLNAKKQPLRSYEDITIFYKKQCVYNPQNLTYGEFDNNRKWRNGKEKCEVFGKEKNFGVSNAKGYPKNLLSYSNPNNNLLHPTQKPVALLEYLIKTYTNEGETVLDNCMGSGSTGIACVNTNRNFIGIELDEKYFNIAKERINSTVVKVEE